MTFPTAPFSSDGAISISDSRGCLSGQAFMSERVRAPEYDGLGLNG